MKLRKTLRIDLPSNITIEADNRSSFRCRSSRRRQVRLIVALDGSRESKAVLHPKNFAINEAWILFKLNDAPVRTEEDGDFNILVLMDAASCYIVATEFVAVRSKELSKKKSLSMLKHGKSHKNELPRRIYVPAELAAHRFIAEAQKEGIACSRAPESELSVFIEEAREGFQEHVGVSRLH